MLVAAVLAGVANRFSNRSAAAVKLLSLLPVRRRLFESVGRTSASGYFGFARMAFQKTAPRGRSDVTTGYEDAVKCLNSLQSNAAYINAAKRRSAMEKNTTLQETKKYLLRSGLSEEQLDSLSVIHVAGTKGKGSTCAFVEAILREHGFRTGFYSSPHLISVHERIRVNGRPLGELEFTRHFWQVYRLLEQRKEHDADMPQYFKFLTVLMFHVFVKANVDVAILEVGIGGQYDCTNIVNSNVCAGITSLGLDHTSLLGDSIEAIAYQKAGIFKPGAPAFTVGQPPQALRVLQTRAAERNCTLSLVPSLESYPWKKSVPTLSIQSNVQKENASLAIQLAATWLSRHNRNGCKRVGVLESTENKIEGKLHGEELGTVKKTTTSGLCFDKVAAALESCKWPGRTQFLPGSSIDFYIDGAHTVESIDCCVSWFRSIAKNTTSNRRYLIFNATGDRDSAKLLAPLKEIDFKKAFFVPNVAGHVASVDQENYNMPVNKQMEKCHQHAEIWGENSVLASSVYEALTMIRKDSASFGKPQVLVTGSLHLVGALLSIVDPELSMSTNF